MGAVVKGDGVAPLWLQHSHVFFVLNQRARQPEAWFRRAGQAGAGLGLPAQEAAQGTHWTLSPVLSDFGSCSRNLFVQMRSFFGGDMNRSLALFVVFG